jgi:polyisoprenyl-phosphate glycosyltransferase
MKIENNNETSNIHISVVIPVYGCCECLNELHKKLVTTLSSISDDFEIIMVNDASPDDSWKAIKLLSEQDERLKGINLSRNFGQHSAITAGLDHAKGSWVVVMDCDLQDQPEEIIKLYNKAQKGFDIVLGRRYQRKDHFIKRLGSKVFYKIYNYLTENDIDNSIANFSIISASVVRALKSLREQNRTYPLFINWVGFKKTSIDIEHSKRANGKSGYTFIKLFKLAVDSIISQSNKPLRVSIGFGFFIAFASLLYAFWLVVNYLIYGVTIEGWTSVMVSIYFIGGLLFANMGVIGLYIGKIFNEVKNRPLYLVKEITFNRED